MAKKDGFNFDTGSKPGFSLDFLKNLTKKQKETILIVVISVVVVAVVVAAIVLISAVSGGGGIGNILGGGGNADNGGSSGGGNEGEEVVIPEVVSKFYVSTNPDRVKYYVGDEPNYSGLFVCFEEPGFDGEATYLSYNGSPEAFTFTGFDSSVATEELVVTVECYGFSDTFTVKIEERPVPQAELVGITMGTLPKTTYYIVDANTKEAFDPTGGIILAEYDDGTTEEVELKISNVSGYSNIESPGEYVLTIKYLDDHGGYAETTMTVTMKAFN